MISASMQERIDLMTIVTSHPYLHFWHWNFGFITLSYLQIPFDASATDDLWNILPKREIAHHEQLLLLPKCFQHHTIVILSFVEICHIFVLIDWFNAVFNHFSVISWRPVHLFMYFLAFSHRLSAHWWKTDDACHNYFCQTSERFVGRAGV